VAFKNQGLFVRISQVAVLAVVAASTTRGCVVWSNGPASARRAGAQAQVL
jgi:hypothetical protein